MSARLQHMVTVAEQRANEHRGVIYTAALAIAVGIALMVTHAGMSIYFYNFGLERGAAIERDKPRVVQAPVKPVDIFEGMSCAELFRACYHQKRLGAVKGKGA